MDLVDLIEEKKFLGQEFLAWLWYKSEERGGAVDIPGTGDGGWTKGTPGEPAQQLYNLKEDPSQKNNRIADYPERADAMAKRIKSMLEERGVTPKKPPEKKKKGKKK